MQTCYLSICRTQFLQCAPVNQNTYAPCVPLQMQLFGVHEKQKSKICPKVAACRLYVGHVPSWKVGHDLVHYHEIEKEKLFVKITPSGCFHFGILFFSPYDVQNETFDLG